MTQTGPRTEAELDDQLSEPTPEVVEAIGRLDGDIIILGASGKMGPSLARMARRAVGAAGGRGRVIGVARFSAGGEDYLRNNGVETIRCDLLAEGAVEGLPDAPNVVLMAGMKFGATGNEAATWAMNSYLPGVVCRKYRRSRMVVFSTGNVYGLVPVESGGSREGDPPRPVGEYAMSCLGRERMVEYFSRSFGMRAVIFRLNYACDLRYGVLVDIARQVRAEQPVDLSMGYFNTIWQGDANAMALRAFDFVATPPRIVNSTSTEMLSVRAVCERFGEFFGRPVRYIGSEATTALLADARLGLKALGPLRVSADELIEKVAGWVADDGRCLGKPTRFESRDGAF